MSELLKLAYKAMDDKLASNLVVLDFRGQSPYVDYFIIGTALNARMARSILDEVDKVASENGYTTKHMDYNSEAKWQLIDLGEVVCHVFYDGEREKYNLEGLWKDLQTVEM